MQLTGPSSDRDGPLRQLASALRFFSRLPVGGSDFRAPSLAGMAPLLPLASLVIAVPPALVLLAGSGAGLPPLFVAGLAVLAATMTTGAMPEDALADAADGLFGGTSPALRLEIMKDSRHGTYGVVAIWGYLLLKTAAIAGLMAEGPFAAVLVAGSAGVLARSASLWLAAALPAARADGAAAGVGALPRRNFWQGVCLAAVVVAAMAAPWCGLEGAVLALVGTAAVTWLWAAWCRRLVGGQTGDLIGALHALVDVTALGCLAAFV